VFWQKSTSSDEEGTNSKCQEGRVKNELSKKGKKCNKQERRNA
jgi:hypothetical protein